MAKIEHIRDKCIGCGTCVGICSEFWEMKDDGKASLKNSTLNPETNNYELEVEEIGCNKDAAASCPTQIIKIIE
jgi:ferredoxin